MFRQLQSLQQLKTTDNNEESIESDRGAELISSWYFKLTMTYVDEDDEGNNVTFDAEGGCKNDDEGDDPCRFHRIEDNKTHTHK